MARTTTRTRKASTEATPVFTGATKATPAADAIAGAILDQAGVRDNFVLAVPTGHYGRVVIGRKASSWLIPRKDASGAVRVILRCQGDKPADSLMQGVRPCDGVDLQLTATEANIDQAAQLVAWSQGRMESLQEALREAAAAKVEQAKAKAQEAKQQEAEEPTPAA